MLRRARERPVRGTWTILFDEIHRFNKAQRDALLPAVEEGLVTLIRQTTENPYYEVNSALLSTQVYELETLGQEDLAVVVRRGEEELGASVSEEIVDLIARRAGGDARSALNIVELAHETADGPITEEQVEDAARKRPIVYDKTADAHYDFTSAFIKSMRGSDPQAAVYYLAAMLEGGEDERFIARRMILLASEDIGNADPRALLVAVAAAQAVEHVGLPEARLNLSQAVIYLALASEVQRELQRDHGRDERRARARQREAAEGAAGRLVLRPEARPRRGLHLSAHRSARLRGRQSPRRAERPCVYYEPSGNGEETK